MKYELSLEERYDEGERVGFSKGEAAGLSQGISQGIAEEKRRMVKSLKQQRVPLEVIAKASSLSLEEVRDIQ